MKRSDFTPRWRFPEKSSRTTSVRAFSAFLSTYHRLPEELVLGVVFAEDEPRVTFKGPGSLNLQHYLVVLQTPLCGRHERQLEPLDVWL